MDEPTYFLAFYGGFERQGVVGFVVDILDLWHLSEDGIGYLVARDVHADRMRLDDCGVSVDIDDKSGEIISFAVNEAEGVIIFSH